MPALVTDERDGVWCHLNIEVASYSNTTQLKNILNVLNENCSGFNYVVMLFVANHLIG